MAEFILSVHELKKSFGSLHALDGISFDLSSGQVSILIGPNGSGKTTLINVITGLYKPDSGIVNFLGRNITGLPPHKLYNMGISRTFQIPSLFTHLTVLENLLVAQKGNPGESFLKSLVKRSWVEYERRTIEKASRVLDLLGLRGLWNVRSSYLSGGQMKLVEIGRALMSDAKLLLLDEPVSGVNPTLAHEIFSRILKLRDELGLSFLIVEHRLDIALRYVDEIFAMALGRLIASGLPDEVLNDKRVIEAYLGT